MANPAAVRRQFETRQKMFTDLDGTEVQSEFEE